MEIPKNPPAWANWFTELGARVATIPFTQGTGLAPRIVVSVPTGQFTTWLTIAGALVQTTEKLSPPVEGVTYATWNPATVRMDDCEFSAHKSAGQLDVVGHPGSRVIADMWPVKAVPDGTPSNRSGAPPGPDLRDEFRQLPNLEKNWTHWYAKHCLSPVVIIGDGREYLQNQREELLEKAPQWFTHEARILLSEDSQQTSNPDRTYFHPFMVLHASVGNDRPWLRAMQPRLVIVTSWSSYTRKHQALFAGAPHIILTNRRVSSSLEAAEFLSISGPSESASQVLDDIVPPHGVFVKSFDHQVLIDQGETSSDEDMEIEL